MLKIGCCGLTKARASYYVQFGVVEVQQTFYQPPRPTTLARWREKAPADFEFTLKAWQPITHPSNLPTWRRLRDRLEQPEQAGYFRASAAVDAAWNRTREAARLLRAGIVLFQCPAGFTPEEEHVTNMRRFFGSLDRGGLRFAWEPRGGWPEGLIRELCRDLELMHCVNPLKQRTATAGTAYFRLHGITGYRYRHGEDDFPRLLGICAGFDEAYCLFNNITMFEDAVRFKALAMNTGLTTGQQPP
jgi:uncharacterized protein YecE (DUF72 family)